MKKKILILIGLVIVLLVLFTILNSKLTEEKVTINEHLPPENYYPYDFRRIRVVEGYYSTYEVLAEPLDYDPNRDPLPKTMTCSVFNIQSGDKELVDYYQKNYKQGLSLNIEIKNISPEETQRLKQSTKESPISMEVRMRIPLERDMYYCESPIQIITVY